MHLTRRNNHRIPVRLYIDQFRGQEHWIGLSFNLSVGGLYLCQKPQAIPNEMGVELSLPGNIESIWTKAEVCSVGSRGGFMGIGLAFTAMATRHRRMLRDWVRMARTQIRKSGNERRSTIRQVAA